MKTELVLPKQGELIAIFEQIFTLENKYKELAQNKPNLFEQMGQTFNPLNEFPFEKKQNKIDEILKLQKEIAQLENSYCKKLHEIYELARNY